MTYMNHISELIYCIVILGKHEKSFCESFFFVTRRSAQCLIQLLLQTVSSFRQLLSVSSQTAGMMFAMYSLYCFLFLYRHLTLSRHPWPSISRMKRTETNSFVMVAEQVFL